MTAARAMLVLGLAAWGCSGLERGHALSDDATPDALHEVDAPHDAARDDFLDASPDAPADPGPSDDVDAAAPPCDDGDPCTVDQGDDPASCAHWPAPDGSACGAGLQCLDGSCVPSCLDAPCPPGLEIHDGCRCRVPPSGLAADRCLTDAGRADCEAIPEGSPYRGQDGHVDGRSLHLAFATPWTAAAEKPPDLVADLRTGLRWSLVKAEGTLPEAEAACASVEEGSWRVPGLAEALPLLDAGAGRCPWLDPRLTVTCPAGPFRLWTATPLPWEPTRRFVLTPTGPSSAAVDTASVVCVRVDEAGEAAPDPAPERLIDLAGGAVLDRSTGLQWQRAPTCEACTWSQALAACRGRPGGWHLATARELWSLLETDHLPPLVNPCFAGPLAADPFADGTWWSGTPWLLDDDPTPRALALDVRTATSSPLDVDARHPALCAREAPLGPARPRPEARANAVTTGDQATTPGRPALAGLPAGGFVAVWLDRPHAGARARAVARRFDPRGDPQDGAELVVSLEPAAEITEPTVAVDGQGSVLLAWIQQVPGQPAVLGVRALGANGEPVGEPRRIASPAGASLGRPTLAGLAGGGFVLGYDEGCDPDLAPPTCEQPVALGAEVNVQRLAASGRPQGSPRSLAVLREGDQDHATVATLPDDRVFAAWLDWAPGVAQLKTRSLDPDTGQGSDERLSGLPTGEVDNPSVFAMAHAAVVLWEHRKTAGARYRAYVSQFLPTGEPLLTWVYASYSPLLQGPTPSTHQRHPQGAAGPSDTFVIVYDIDGGPDYLQSPNDHDGWAVGTQSFTEWAHHNGPPRRENAFARGDQTGGSVQVLADGQQVVLFTSASGDATGQDVWFRRSEAACGDDLDNDGDGAVDALDPDCYGRPLP